MNKEGRSAVQTLAGCFNCLMSLASTGIMIWGTVLAFSNDRWARYARGDTAFCDSGLYGPVAITLIVQWSLMAFGVCCACCVFGSAFFAMGVMGMANASAHRGGAREPTPTSTDGPAAISVGAAASSNPNAGAMDSV